MRLTPSTLQQLRLLGLLVAVSAAVGAAYSLVRLGPGDGVLLAVASGASIGATISACITGDDRTAACCAASGAPAWKAAAGAARATRAAAFMSDE